MIIGPSLLALLNRLMSQPKEYRDELRGDLKTCRDELEERTEERDAWHARAMSLETNLLLACIRLRELGEDPEPFRVKPLALKAGPS